MIIHETSSYRFIPFAANSLVLDGLGEAGDKALAISPIKDFVNDSCIQLYIHLHDENGADLTSLKLYLSSPDLFTARLLVDIAQDPHVPSDAWRHLQVPIPAGRHGLVVEATVGDTENAVIAISYVKLLDECRTHDTYSQCE